MHNAALAAVGLAGWRYQLLPVPPELFAETVAALPEAGFRGVNVTIPHKRAALALATAPDAAGFRDRSRQHADLRARRPDRRRQHRRAGADRRAAVLRRPAATALVLGAGGSARAAVWALLDAGAREVRIWNRTPARARALAAELGGDAVDERRPADLLVHCTASGLDPAADAFKPLPIAADDVTSYECVVDLVYGDIETPLVRAARARSVRVVAGRELLVRQGALSFELFTGRPAPIDVMRGAVDVP